MKKNHLLRAFGWLLLAFTALPGCAQADNQNAITTKKMNQENPAAANYDTAYLANGCFWCTEAIFEELKGVVSAVSGYTGGHVVNPTYKEVCTGTTGHAECLEIVYDPAVISFDELLEVFWETHDPTTLNRQGNDVGPQYRSGVFYVNDEQKKKAEQYKEALNKSGAFDKPIVTEITKFETFYSAEDYHQEYFANNENNNPYCRIVIRPKLDKFRKVFKDKLKEQK